MFVSVMYTLYDWEAYQTHNLLSLALAWLTPGSYPFGV